MYKYESKKLPKSTTEFTLTIPKEDIKKEAVTAFKRLQQELVVDGFRKGQVPSDIARKHITQERTYQDMIQAILPKIYEEIVKKESLRPIVSPKVDLLSAKEGEDWKIKIVVCEKPSIELGDYKKAIKELKSKHKADDIWVPGKEKNPKDDSDKKSHLINEVLEALMKSSKIEIPDLIMEEEVNHRLTKLVDDIQKIGLTTDSYLKSKNLTMDSLKAQFRKEIEDTYKLEFILSEVADKENIKVEKDELDKLFVNIKDEKEKKLAEANSYYYATILRKQKTIDFLIAL